MKNLIAFCGLDCESCEARKATVENDSELRKKVAAEWSKLNGVEITSEMINCDGCRLDGRKTPFCDSLCPIRQCALVEFALQNFQADFLWALEKTQGLFLFTVGTDFSRLAQENTRKAQRNILLNCGGNKCCPKGCKNKNRNLRLPFLQSPAGGFAENSAL